MTKELRRRKLNGKNLTDEEKRVFNIEQRSKYPHDPLPYLPVPCLHPDCFFHFVPIDNAYETLCPVHRIRHTSKSSQCPYMNHEMEDSGFFSWGKDDDLPTDYNHANYTPVR